MGMRFTLISAHLPLPWIMKSLLAKSVIAADVYYLYDLGKVSLIQVPHVSHLSNKGHCYFHSLPYGSPVRLKCKV